MHKTLGLLRYILFSNVSTLFEQQFVRFQGNLGRKMARKQLRMTEGVLRELATYSKSDMEPEDYLFLLVSDDFVTEKC